MTSPHRGDLVDLRFGDCLAVLRELPDSSVDVVITDPPYGLADLKPAQIATAFTAWLNGDRDHVPDGRGFMGRAWDSFVPPPAVWDECLRVLKPGGHLAAFAGSRTYDLMGLSIRLAGFEIRDGLQWLYGSGMPKGQNVGKAIDKAAGAEREVVGVHRRHGGGSPTSDSMSGPLGTASELPLTAPATPEAARWEGWNTSLRPANEPIVLARKPIRGTVAANVLATGCGAMNVDACRVGSGGQLKWSKPRDMGYGGGTDVAGSEATTNAQGRWPANVLLSHSETCHEPGECVPGCSDDPQWVSGGPGQSAYTDYRWQCDCGHRYGNFTPEDGDVSAQHATHLAGLGPDGCAPGCPVAELDAQSGNARSSGVYKGDGSRRDSSATVGFEIGEHRPATMYDDSGGASRFFPSFRYQAKAPAAERPKIDGKGWPTVKPQGLMRWLVRLLTPPGGTVLDPFAGTSATLQAARDEGFASIGIERDEFAYLLSCQRLERSQAEIAERAAAAEPTTPPLFDMAIERA